MSNGSTQKHEPEVCEEELIEILRSLTDALKYLDKKGFDVAGIHLNQAIEEVGIAISKSRN